MRTIKKHLLWATASVPLSLTSGVAFAQACPPIGADSGCGATITITDKGSSVTFSGNGPYDGSDDTLVGVVNNSSQPIFAIGLKSATDIFGFDGDGISTYGAASNPKDTTGYGGPNSYYSNIGAGSQSGVVNFVNPLTAHGGSAYFSLEEALTKPTAIQDIVNGSIKVTLSGTFDENDPRSMNLQLPHNIMGVFTPNGSITLAQAASQTGFAGFDFQQTITNWPNADLHPASNPGSSLTAPPSFLDPPPGGYNYCVNPPLGKVPWPACQTSYPFYPTTKTANSVTLFDSPRDPLLQPGQSLDFKVRLIGILPNFVSGTDCLSLAVPTCIDLGVGFDWKSTYNGSYGGIAVTASNEPFDPTTADGTMGGISLTSIYNSTTYSPFNVTTVNGVAIPIVFASGPIDTSQAYFSASQLGVSVDPDFQGGVLRIDQTGQIYSLAFTVNDLGGTIDAFGNQATLSGAFTDTSTVAPGIIDLVDSVGGGQITFNSTMGTSDHPLGKLVNDASLVFGANFVGYFSNVTNNGTLMNAGIVSDALVNTGTIINSGTYNADVSNLLAGDITNSGTWNGALLANSGLVTNASNWNGTAVSDGMLINSGFWNGSITDNASALLMNAPTGTITGLVINNGSLASAGVLGGGLTNSGTANVAGTIDGAITNTDTVTLTGTLASDGSPISNATNSLIDLAANALNGAGAVSNAGTIKVGTPSGNGTLNAASLTNSGLVALQNGRIGDQVVLTGTYNGATGASFTADVNMGLNTAQSDRVIAASVAGSTTVSFANIGSKKIYFSNPILLIQSSGGTGTFTAATDAQTSQALASRGIVDFGFQKLAGTGNNYGIVAKVNAASASTIAGQTSAYLNALNFSGFADGRQIDGLAIDGGKWRGQFWSRAIESSDDYDLTSRVSDTYSPTTSTNTHINQTGIQFGADWVAWTGKHGSRLRLGVTGGYSEGDSHDATGGKIKAPFYGAYGIFMIGGLMLDAQYERIDATVTPTAGVVSNKLKLKGSIDRFAGGASLQGKVGIATFEPFVRYAYAKLDLPDATLTAGEGTLAFRNLKSELVEGGVKLMHTESVGTANIIPVFSVAYVEEMGNAARTMFIPDGGAGPVDIITRREQGYMDIALGVTVRSKTSGIEAFVRGEGRAGDGDNGYGVNAGMRLRF